MLSEKSIFTLIIPEWVNKVRIGTVRTQYYEKGNLLPKNIDVNDLKLVKLGKKEYYVDSKGKKIIKNNDKAGNGEYWNVNGQSFYSNNMSWKDRATIVNFYHRYLNPFIKEQLKEPFPKFLAYKLDMEIIIYEVFSRTTPDITNMWILAKMIEDSIVEAGILSEDSPEFRMHTGFGYKFVDKPEDRKLVITFKYNKY